MTTVQIRDVPDDVTDALKEQAASRGQSLTQYLVDELTRLSSVPTREQVIERILSRDPVAPDVDLLDMVSRSRDER